MPRVLVLLLIWAVGMLAVLSLVGWPRLRSTSTHYDLIRLRSQVTELQQQHHLLEVALEEQRSPPRLGQRAAALGLIPRSALVNPSTEEKSP